MAIKDILLPLVSYPNPSTRSPSHASLDFHGA